MRTNEFLRNDKNERIVNMMDNKQTIPRFGGQQDNLLFWATRVKAILAEEEALDKLDWEKGFVLESVADTKKPIKACSVILRGLGDSPLEVVVKHSESPRMMLDILHERYASKSIFHKAQVLSQIAQKR